MALITGGPGNDTFISTLEDSIDGGPGFDRAQLPDNLSQLQSIRVDLASGRVTLGNVMGGFEGGPNYALNLISIEALYGGKGWFSLFIGDAGDNWLSGSTVVGGGGNDTLEGGVADYSGESTGLSVLLEFATGTRVARALVSLPGQTDEVRTNTLRLGSGDDRMLGSGRDINGSWIVQRAEGGAGHDLLVAARVDGGPGDDTLSGGMADYTSNAGPVTASIASGLAFSADGVDTLGELAGLQGSRHDDVLEGGADNDVLRGGAGNDTLDGLGGNDSLDGEGGDDLVRGGPHADTLYGNAGRDTLDGGAGDNWLFGGDGDDLFIAGWGHNLYIGDDGFDALSFAGMALPVSADLSSGELVLDGVRQQLDDVEALYGGKAGDLLVGNSQANLLDGREGQDTLQAGPGDDTLMGSSGTDTLDGGAGLDLADYSGFDTPLRIDLAAGVATSVLLAGKVDLLLSIEAARGGRANDEMMGSAADNTLAGGAGNDTLDGGAGFDLADYAEASGAVAVDLATGIASGAAGRDTLRNIEGAIGSAFADRLAGDSRANLLQGGADADTLSGGSGNDTLDGGAGSDLLSGDAGNDILVFSDVADTLDGGDGQDRIVLRVPNAGSPSFAIFDLQSGLWQVLMPEPVMVTLNMRAIENVELIAGFAIVRGDGADNVLTGDDLSGRDGNDSLVLRDRGGPADGGAGIDRVYLGHPAAAYIVQRDGAATLSLTLTPAIPLPVIGVDDLVLRHQLTDVERLVFSDSCLAFGDRAIDVAKVAFALWSPAIAPSSTLFGKGIDWYDDGHSYAELIDFALTYYSQLSDTQFAQNLLANVKSTRSAAEVLGLINQQGRTAAVQLFADDAANMAQIELAGLKSQGIVCALAFNSETLFDVPG